MAEIKVFTEDGAPAAIGEDEISEIYAGIYQDVAQVEAFTAFHNYAAKYAAIFEKPNIPELLLKKIITLGGGLVIPVITREKLVKKKTGGADTGVLRVKFDDPTVSTTANGTVYIIPPGEEVSVTGIIVGMVCEPIVLPKKSITIRDFSERVDTVSALMGGFYEKIKCALPHHAGLFTIAGQNHTKMAEFTFAPGKTAEILAGVFEYVRGERKYLEYLPLLANMYINAAFRAKTGSIYDLIRARPAAVYKSPAAPPLLASLIEVERSYSGKFSPVVPESVLADAIRGDIVDIYEAAIVGDDIAKQAAKHREKSARKAFLAEITAGLDRNRATIGAYMNIILKKFGEKRAGEIAKRLAEKPALSLNVKRLLEIMTPAERKPVEAEYKQREKNIENSAKNKCEHKQYYNKVFSSRLPAKAPEDFQALKGFFKKAAHDKMIECNTCGFDIICPHRVEVFEAEAARADQRAIAAILSKYVDKNGAKTNFFCKICGELLSTLESGEDYRGVDDSAGADEELSTFLWTEIAQLTRFIKFAVMIDSTKVISAARDACYPHIHDIERQLLKSRTSNAEELKAKKKLYATIYGFAYFTHLIGKNVTFRDFNPQSGANLTAEAIKHCVRLITLIRNIVIKSIPGMTPDIIKNKLIEAYKTLNVATVISTAGNAEDILDTFLVDPIYHYLANMYAATTPGKTGGMFKNVDAIMGATVQKLEKSDDIFGSVFTPNFSKWNQAAFMKLSAFSGKILDKGALIVAGATPGYTAAAFELFLRRLRSRLQVEPVFAEVTVGKEENHSRVADFEVQWRPPHQKDQDETAAFLELERNYFAYLWAAYSQGYSLAPGDGNTRWSEKNTTKIGRIFDLEGKKHDWLYVVGEKTLSARDISATVSRGETVGEITDRKCKTCGVLWSAAADLDEDQIRAALRSAYTTMNFFKYFETRCPVSGTHERSGEKCTKCGHNVAFLTAITPAAVEYKTKYMKVFEKEKSIVAAQVEFTKYPPPRDFSDIATEFASWTQNFDIVLELAEKIEVNHRLILALGSVEKQDYDAVASGAYVPAEVDERDSTRAGLIEGHIRRLIIEYNRLRYIKNLAKPPQDLIEIFEAAGVSRAAAAGICERMPPVLEHIHDHILFFKRSKKPREIVAFLIQSWCAACLKILADTTPETAKIRREFVRRYVVSSLRYEELISKPGQFNWSLLYDEKKEARQLDIIQTDDITEAPQPADDDDDGGGFDIDIDPDADPEDTDAGDTNVGEDYGID